MRYIQDTRPIVIIDEPQSVDNTPKAKEAIASLNPLCVFRYSATHKEKINLLYRLTPVDAYQMGLVKQISVSSNQVAGGFNQAYVKLLSVSNDNGFKAKVEIDVKGKSGTVMRKTVTVKPNDKIAFLADNENAKTVLFQIIAGEMEPDEGELIWGSTITKSYFPKDKSDKSGSGIGLVNLKKRLNLIYPEKYLFVQEQKENSYVTDLYINLYPKENETDMRYHR